MSKPQNYWTSLVLAVAATTSLAQANAPVNESESEYNASYVNSATKLWESICRSNDPHEILQLSRSLRCHFEILSTINNLSDSQHNTVVIIMDGIEAYAPAFTTADVKPINYDVKATGSFLNEALEYGRLKFLHLKEQPELPVENLPLESAQSPSDFTTAPLEIDWFRRVQATITTNQSALAGR